MSSLRNAVQRRNHRERAQPREREKWGLLEKHKDYSARARDYNAKKDKLRQLRQKVLEKNPDEFYFGMISRKGPTSTGKNRTGTVNGNRGNQSLSQEAVRLLKTQDLGYVRTMRNKAIKEVELLEKSVVGIRSAGRRIIYIDDQTKQGQNSITVDEKDGEVVAVPGNLEIGKLRKPQHEEQSKLEARLERGHKRLKALAEAEEALDIQRAKMAKSLTVGGVNKQGVKFKARERKR